MAQSKFIQITPADPVSDLKPTDWKMFFICQKDGGKSPLIKPSTKNDYTPEKSTYPTTAEQLIKWTEPEISSGLERTLLLRLQQFESSYGLKQSFIENEAIFHKQCLNKYDKQKLVREREKAKKRGNSESVGSSGEGGLASP